MENKIKEAINANIVVHSAMADDYNKVEPHFRPESIERVEKMINEFLDGKRINAALDLGCGTGFMINILKKITNEIVGVDVTQAMLDKVDLTGSPKIKLINSDTGSVVLPYEYFDLATAYTFLDHLYDMMPTFTNTYKSLKKGGLFYADLSPNFFFWDAIKKLDQSVGYDPIVQREINAVLKKDEEIESEFGVDKKIFAMAEHQKHNLGGLNEDEIKSKLSSVGFKNIRFIYHWFVGQAQLINDESMEISLRKESSALMHSYLVKSLPLSRHLFKYVGFIAQK